MKDYFIGIYRREKNDPRMLVGVVEEVGVEGNKSFSNLDELWTILNPSKPETVETKKRNRLNKPNKLSERSKLNEPNKPNKLNKPQHQ